MIECEEGKDAGRNLYRSRLFVDSALSEMAAVREGGNLLWPTIRLTALLHSKGLITDDEVLIVFGVDCDKWEVAK